MLPTVAGAVVEVFFVPDDYPTIERAISSYSPGSVILVKPGTYSEGIYGDYGGDNFILKAVGGPEQTILTGEVIITGSENFTIDGFTFSETYIEISKESQNVTLVNNKFIDTTNVALLVYENSSAFVANNLFNNTGAAISCDGSEITIINNEISDNGNNANWSCTGIGISGGSLARIHNNRILNNGTNRNATAGINVAFGGNTVDIRNNIIVNNGHPNWGMGIDLQDVSSGIIANNVIRESHDGIQVSGNVTVLVTSNIITDNYYGIWISGRNDTVTSSYNDYWNNSADYAQNNPNTVIGDIHTNPLFVNLGNGDYRLQASSPCIDAGNPSSDYNDRSGFGGQRAARGDMGAYGGQGPYLMEHIRNAPPTLNPIGDQSIEVFRNLEFTVTASNPANSVLTYLIHGKPDNAYFYTDSGIFHWFPGQEHIGEHHVTFVVSDGIFADFETITITVLPRPNNPTVTITNPPSESYNTDSTPITISGTCSDADGDLDSVTVENSANGYQDTQSVSGSSDNFSFSVPLKAGSNPITVTVYDSGDRTGTDTITANLVRNPEVTITYPPSDPYNADSTPITISGTCGDVDGDLERIEVVNNANGYEKDTIISGDSYTFSFSGLPLVEGDNPIEVTVYDSGNRTGTDTITVIYTSGETISGTITDGTIPIAATVEAWQDGSLVASTNTSDGSYSLSVSAGAYAIRAYANGYYAQVLPDEITAPASGVEIALESVPTILSSSVNPCDFWDQDGTIFDEPTDHIPKSVQIGDVITAKDPDGVICGLAYVGDAGTGEGDYFIHVNGDDPNTTGVDEGASEGDTISFFINGYPARVTSGTPAWNSGGSLEVSLSAPAVSFGDVSGNGEVTAYDAALILQHIRGLITLEANQIERGNVDGEPGLTANDAILILQRVVGLIPKFPIE